jgi:hypothetical protein
MDILNKKQETSIDQKVKQDFYLQTLIDGQTFICN